MNKLPLIIFILFLTCINFSRSLADQEHSGTITADETWQIGDNNHIITGNVTVADSVTLTIEAGAVVKFAGDYELKVNGRLLAEGTAGKPIIFTSNQTNPAPGDWRYVYFEDAEAGNVMAHCEIRYAGSNSFRGSLFIWRTADFNLSNSSIAESGGNGIFVGLLASLSMENSTVSNCVGNGMLLDGRSTSTIKSSTFTTNGGYGIFGGNFDHLTTISDCMITNNGGGAVRLSAPSVGLLTNTTITGNDPDEIEVYSGATGTANWNHGRPYVLLGDIDVMTQETLTLAPGSILKFETNKDLEVRGRLIARGTPENHIIFTSNQANPAAGDWEQIYFEVADSSALDYCDVMYGGGGIGVNRGMVRAWRSSHILLSNSTFTQSASRGLWIDTDSDLSVQGCLFENNQEDGIRVRSARPDIQTSQFIGNQTGIYIESGVPNIGDPIIGGYNAIYGNTDWQLYQGTTNAIAATRNFWNSADSLTIDAGIFDNEENEGSIPVLFTPFLTADPFLNNRPPGLTPISDQTILFGIQTDVFVQAADPDGDPLTLEGLNLPAFASFNDNGDGTGVLSLTPPDSSTGVFPDLIMTASDGKLTVHETFTLRIVSGNRPPIADAGPDQTVAENQLVMLDGSASSDPDTDPLTYTWIQVGGPGVTINGANAAVASFSAPQVASTTDLKFRLNVRDLETLASDFVTITVENTVNEPPVVQGPESKDVFVGEDFEFSISVSDPNGDPVTFSTLNLPPGSTVYDPGSSTKFFQWQPGDADVGAHLPMFVADDGSSADTLTVEINVTQPPGPVIEKVTPTFGRVGDLVTLRGFAFGEGTGSLVFNGVPAAAMISADTVATAIVPELAQTGPLILISPEGKISNSKYFSVLPPPQVNLIVKALEASAPFVLVGNLVPLTATIKNDGVFDAEARLTFFDNHPDSGGTAISTPQTFSIDANDVIERSFEWTPQTPGVFEIHARITGADPEESILSDNLVAGELISVIPTTPFEFVNIYAPEDEFIIGQPKNYTIQLMNSSAMNAQVTEIAVDGGFGFILATALPISLQPGEIRSFDFSVTLPEETNAGPYLTNIRVKTANGNEFSQSLKFEATRENPTITLRLLDDDSGLPLSGVRVFANGVEQPSTNSTGEAEFKIPVGMQLLAVFFKDGFLPEKLDIPATDASRTFNVFMKPGEIIVSDVEVEQLTSEEIQNLGLDLNDPENYNYFRFSFNIQFSDDSPPQAITTVFQSSSDDPDPPSDDQCQKIRFLIERVVDLTAEFCAGRYSWRRWTLCDDDTIHVSTFSYSLPLYLYETLPIPCSDIDRKEEEVFELQLRCKFKKVYLCSPEFDPSPDEPRGGVMTPSPDVSIPYVLAVDGNIRTLKEFFTVTLALANQADPSFSVTNLEANLAFDFGQSAALTVVKEAEPLPDLQGGQTASTSWVIRGDQVGIHSVQVDISGVLQPGNIAISTIALIMVIVNAPPELELKLNHPGSVTEGSTFSLSAEVTNVSESTQAPLTSIRILLGGENTAELISEAVQELGDIAPGETETAFWTLKALGSGKLQACNASSGSNLGFTLLIDDQACEDAVPADTTFDTSVPPGKVVVLGTEIGIPNIIVFTTGTDQTENVVTVQALTDESGEYHFPKKVYGSNLNFHLQIPTALSNQDVVRPPFLDFTRTVEPDTTAMPGFEYGAKNQYQKLMQIIASLKDTTSIFNLSVVIAKEYREELMLLQTFLNEAEQNGLWDASLMQTREEYYRLFLALQLISRTRVDAETMAYLSADTIGSALIAIIEMFLEIIKLEDIIGDVIEKKALSALGGQEAVDEYLQQVWKSNLKDFGKNLEGLQTAIFQLFEIAIARGFPGEEPNVVKDFSNFFAGQIIRFYTQTASTFVESNKIRTFAAEQFAGLYARITDELIERTIMLAQNYAGPDSAGSLPYSFSRVSYIGAEISQGTLDAEQTTEGLQLAQGLLNGINKDLGTATKFLTIAQLTPAAPVAVPVKKILSAVKKITDILEKVVTVGAAVPAPLHLFTGIPAGLEEGVNAAFDIPQMSSSAPLASLSLTNKSASTLRPGNLQTRSSDQEITLREMSLAHSKSTDLSAAFQNYRTELQRLRDYVSEDAFVNARRQQAAELKVARNQLSRILAETEALLSGGAFNAAIQNLPGADSLYASFVDSLNQFNASRLALPWGFISYSIIGELEGGVSNPGYDDTKAELLEIIDDLHRRTTNLEPLLLTAFNDYDNLGLLVATVIVDSVWFAVNGKPASEVSTSPATIVVHARLRNLSSVDLSGLQISLGSPDISGLSFATGVDTTIEIPALQPDDNAAGGADEYTALWTLEYQGSLSEQRGLAFRATLTSDSANVALVSSPGKILNLKALDSDSDGMPDDFENQHNLMVATNDAADDPDSDLLTNLQEYLMGTNPRLLDSDGDAIADGVEVSQGSSPLDPQSPVTPGSAALVLPALLETEPESEFTVPVQVNAAASVKTIQFTVEYDSTLLVFHGIQPGADSATFAIESFELTAIDTTATESASQSLRVLLTANASLPGINELVLLRFQASSNLDSTALISINRDPKKSFIKDRDDLPVKIVSFSDSEIRNALIVSVDDKRQQSIPEAFQLYQNYPNPFNPSTTIRFEVPKPTEVNIKIYNILGQLVTTLIDDKFEPGSYSVLWRGENFNGVPVSSGLYFIRMKSPEFKKVKKILLVR